MSTTHPDVSPLDYAAPVKRKGTALKWLVRIVIAGAIVIGGVSVFLPSLCKAREPANRAKCASNLHQIGLAISLYAGEHGGQYPDSFAELITQEQLTPAVFVCPSSNDEAADGDSVEAVAGNLSKPHHLSYVYLGKGMTTRTVKADTLIAYEAPENHQNDGMNMLFGDGHCEWMAMAQAKKILAPLVLSAGGTPR